MKKLKLSKPIMVNNEEVKELPYDLENMTAKNKLNAMKSMALDNVPLVQCEELDPNYHFYLFIEAVSKADSSIIKPDLMRMSAKDITKAAGIVRGFFYLDSEDLSQTNSSENQ